MLAVIVSPHGFTTALMSEASIVPGASHRRITPTACPGRVLGAASQVRSCFVQPSQLVIQLRVARPPPNCTCIFRCIQLSVCSFRLPLSRRLSFMDGLVTVVANNQGLSPAGSHDFDPEWSLSSFFLEVCEFANVVNFDVFP